DGEIKDIVQHYPRIRRECGRSDTGEQTPNGTAKVHTCSAFQSTTVQAADPQNVATLRIPKTTIPKCGKIPSSGGRLMSRVSSVLINIRKSTLITVLAP